MISETLGSFILVIVYLTQTEERYKLSNDAAITLMIISGSYIMAMALSHPMGAKKSWTQSPLNPAIALAEMTMTTFSGNITEMQWAWIFITFDWLGALLAVFCYEFIFKKAQNSVERRDDEVAVDENIAAEQRLMD